MDAGMDFNEEALEALSDPAQTETELAEGFKKWLADLEGGALANINALLECDRGTAREKLWIRLRDEYENCLQGGLDGKGID